MIDDESVCRDGYPEHDDVITYSGEDGTGWTCQRCGAEGWEESTCEPGN